jgi:hypothetical protein
MLPLADLLRKVLRIGEGVSDIAGVRDRSREPVQFGNHERVADSYRREGLRKTEQPLAVRMIL